MDYHPWLLLRANKLPIPLEIDAVKPHGKALVAKIKGCDDRDMAILYRNQDIAVMREQLPEPEAGEIYWSDLVGLTVINTTGESLGIVSRVFATGANDVIVTQGERERLIPFVRDRHILDVDLGQSTDFG